MAQDEHEFTKTCKLHENMLREIHLAVCGSDRLGVPGLVNEVKRLKEFRNQVVFRSAWISGAVAALALGGKYVLSKLNL